MAVLCSLCYFFRALKPLRKNLLLVPVFVVLLYHLGGGGVKTGNSENDGFQVARVVELTNRKEVKELISDMFLRPTNFVLLSPFDMTAPVTCLICFP